MTHRRWLWLSTVAALACGPAKPRDLNQIDSFPPFAGLSGVYIRMRADSLQRVRSSALPARYVGFSELTTEGMRVRYWFPSASDAPTGASEKLGLVQGFQQHKSVEAALAAGQRVQQTLTMLGAIATDSIVARTDYHVPGILRTQALQWNGYTVRINVRRFGKEPQDSIFLMVSVRRHP